MAAEINWYGTKLRHCRRMYTSTSRSNGVSALLNTAASRVVEIYAKNKSRSVGEWMKSTAKTGCAVGCLLHCTFFMSCVLLQNTHTQNCNPLAPATRRNSGSRWRIEDRLSVLPSLITPDVLTFGASQLWSWPKGGLLIQKSSRSNIRRCRS